MQELNSRRLTVFAAVGTVSGLICWSGLFFIPEGSVWLRIYPGTIFGLALFGLGQIYHLDRCRSRVYSLIILVVTSILSWQAALHIGFMYGKPVPMLVAGALGAVIVAIGLVGAWAVQKRVGTFLLFITIAGAVGGQIAQLIWDNFPKMGDDWWTLILFVEWQTLVMFAIAYLIRMAIQQNG